VWRSIERIEALIALRRIRTVVTGSQINARTDAEIFGLCIQRCKRKEILAQGGSVPIVSSLIVSIDSCRNAAAQRTREMGTGREATPCSPLEYGPGSLGIGLIDVIFAEVIFLEQQR